MIILGIDPGLATIGYGVIRAEGVRQSVIDYGVITTPPKQPLPTRLKMIYESVLQLYDRFNPDAVAFHLYARYTDFFLPVLKNTTLAIPMQSVMPSVTPVKTVSVPSAGKKNLWVPNKKEGWLWKPTADR